MPHAPFSDSESAAEPVFIRLSAGYAHTPDRQPDITPRRGVPVNRQIEEVIGTGFANDEIQIGTVPAPARQLQ
jgi:hypothetical protein